MVMEGEDCYTKRKCRFVAIGKRNKGRNVWGEGGRTSGRVAVKERKDCDGEDW